MDAKTELQRANRIAAKRSELGKLNDADLKNAAIDAGIGDEIVGDETREEIEFAIAQSTVISEELNAAKARQAEADAAARAEREAFYKTPVGKKQRAVDELDARDRAIRGVHSSFIKALPSEARSSGALVIKPDAPEAGQYPVPDGVYRVMGSDWLMDFRGGKWAGAARAHALAPPDWTEIPDAPGGAVGGKSKTVE